MQYWNSSLHGTQEVAVLLFPRFSNHCLANTIEPLRAANDLLMREAYRWRFVTVDGEPVVSSSGLPVTPNGKLRDHAGGAFLFVMSSYDAQLHADFRTSRALQNAARRFDSVAGLDTGAWLMAEAGLLEGRKATIHWDEMASFSEAFPGVDAVAERFVIDQNRITCGGAMTAFDLVLDLIRHTHGAVLCLEVSGFFLHQSTEAPTHHLFGAPHSAIVEKCVSLMSANLENPLSIETLARRVKLTQRTLSRLFQSELGVPPKTVYKRLRLSAARRYAQQSTYSISEIAIRCGYANAAAMTRAFVAEYGQPPSVLRREGRG